MKVDLAEIEKYERGIIRQLDDIALVAAVQPMHQRMREGANARLALIRVARAAKAYMTKPYLTQDKFLDARLSLVAALSDIEDSANE